MKALHQFHEYKTKIKVSNDEISNRILKNEKPGIIRLAYYN